MRRGVKRALIASVAMGLTTLVLPSTPAFAIAKVPCTSSTVELINALNIRSCFSGNGSTALIGSFVSFKAGSNDASVRLSNGSSVLLRPGGSYRWPLPGASLTSVSIFNP
ncbi:hypothetical protein AB0877_24645 [Micromonospora sp. NPDC047644]|uniref:hypothetical protein n=1 Tax=Micromonospora sp. NPDC047644 TaxID=3157203 RepID=UPI00345333AC